MAMNKLAVILGSAAFALTSAPAAADNFSYTGTLSDPNQVLLFNFVVGSTSTVSLRTYSYAGGTNSDGTSIAPRRLRPDPRAIRFLREQDQRE
jgi:hypothetical protein